MKKEGRFPVVACLCACPRDGHARGGRWEGALQTPSPHRSSSVAQLCQAAVLSSPCRASGAGLTGPLCSPGVPRTHTGWLFVLRALRARDVEAPWVPSVDPPRGFSDTVDTWPGAQTGSESCPSGPGSPLLLSHSCNARFFPGAFRLCSTVIQLYTHIYAYNLFSDSFPL